MTLWAGIPNIPSPYVVNDIMTAEPACRMDGTNLSVVPMKGKVVQSLSVKREVAWTN
jgi:hypothetical protein